MTALSSGTIFIHSCPRALTPHVEWAISRALGKGVTLSWSAQTALPGTFRAEYQWWGPETTGAEISSALLGWDQLRYEVSQDATPVSDGMRWMHTPQLGIFSSQTDAAGNLVLSENRVTSILDFAHDDAALLREGLQRSLGTAWDKELEVFRYASDEVPVRWLSHVG
jgi:hypothetical protein